MPTNLVIPHLYHILENHCDSIIDEVKCSQASQAFPGQLLFRIVENKPFSLSLCYTCFSHI